MPSAVPLDVIIRPARREDVPAMHAALKMLAATIGLPERVKSSAGDLDVALFGPDPLLQATLAETEGRMAGMCLHFPTFSTWMGRPGVYVQDLFVDERARGARVGERLLRHVARAARARGGSHMRLSVDEGNERAAAFYRRNGFVAAPDEHVHKVLDEDFERLCDGEDLR